MKYRPALPEKNDNISHNHPLKEFGILSCGLVMVFLLVYLILGLLVDIAAEKISYETESALFSIIKEHMDLPETKESEDGPKLQALVNKLQECTSLPYPITVHIIQQDAPNAIALPGGHVLVFQGLLDAITSEKGRAFVLAHELAHFQGKDHLRGMGRGLVLYTLSTFLMGNNSTISMLMAPSKGLTQAQFSQSREFLADKRGIDTFHCTYGNIEGAMDFFDYILTEGEENDMKVLHYFSSHPETVRRKEDLLSYAKEKGY